MPKMEDSPMTSEVFTGWVHDHFMAKAPYFDFGQVGKRGLASALFTAKEAEQVSVFGALPRWLVLGLQGLTGPAPVGVQANRQELVGPIECVLSPPLAAYCHGALLDGFVSKKGHGPGVWQIDGGQSRHYTRNFSRLSRTQEGWLPEMSNPSALIFMEYLEKVEPKQLEGRTFISVVEGSVVYTHWLLDTLPRLLLAMEGGLRLEDYDHFLFATVAHKFHRDVLSDLGVPNSKVVTRERDGLYFETEAFTFVSPPRSNFMAASQTYDLVRGFFGVGGGEVSRGRRIFVSRSKAKRRRILNEPEVMNFLTPFGFEAVCFEDLTIWETAKLLAEASHVVSPHGAGLANLIFAQAGTRVLEMFNAHLSPEYWTICNQRGLLYFPFEASGADGLPIDTATREATPFFERNGLDIFVPMKEFKNFFTSEFLKEDK
jgi:hypothetical protein